jgi:hypothetical protein
MLMVHRAAQQHGMRYLEIAHLHVKMNKKGQYLAGCPLSHEARVLTSSACLYDNIEVLLQRRDDSAAFADQSSTLVVGERELEAGDRLGRCHCCTVYRKGARQRTTDEAQ